MLINLPVHIPIAHTYKRSLFTIYLYNYIYYNKHGGGEQGSHGGKQGLHGSHGGKQELQELQGSHGGTHGMHGSQGGRRGLQGSHGDGAAQGYGNVKGLEVPSCFWALTESSPTVRNEVGGFGRKTMVGGAGTAILGGVTIRASGAGTFTGAG